MRATARLSPTFERAADDFYIEPRWTVDALLRAERFTGAIYDPACGRGTILMAAAERGMCAEGSDIVDRGCQGRGMVVRTPFDFLAGATPETRWQISNIVSNPPYGDAVAFITRALELAPRKVAMLLRLPFIASATRAAFFKATPLSRIHILTPRPSMPPGAMLAAGDIKAEGGKTDYAWFVWDHGHSGEPTINWLQKTPAPAKVAA